MSGGKSLELMQRRLLTGQPAPAPGGDGDAPSNDTNQQGVPPPQQGDPPQQQPDVSPQQGEQPSQPQLNQNPRPGKSSAALMATQAREHATQQSQPPPPQEQQQTPPGGRPKGKNFAAMAMSNSTKPPEPVPAPPAPAPPAAMAAGRPKGKDFGAMASRMGAQQPVRSPPAPAPAAPAPPPAQRVAVNRPPMDVEAQRLRAQQMQAAARAAAGLPPLEKYTATTVTTIPPPITPAKPGVGPRPSPPGQPQMYQHQQQQQPPPQQQPQQYQQIQQHQQQQQQQQQQLPPQQLQQSHMQHQQPIQPPPQQQQQRQQYQQPQPAIPQQTPPQVAQRKVASKPAPISRQGSSSSRSRPYNATAASARSPSSGLAAPDKPAAPRPTPQPTVHEGRLSLTSKQQTGAPLVGKRIQDLVQSIDPNYTLDAEAEEQVLQIADDFLDKVTRQSIRLAQHRGSKVLDVQDIQVVLAKHWGISVPGLGLPNIRPLKAGKTTVSRTASGSIPGSGGTKRKSTSESANANRKKSATSASSGPIMVASPN